MTRPIDFGARLRARRALESARAYELARIPRPGTWGEGRAEHTAYSANILEVAVETNCPRGGNSSHGGRTVLELVDCASTEIQAVVFERDGCRGVRLELGGDTECSTLIECLRFAAGELERQLSANQRKRSEP